MRRRLRARFERGEKRDELTITALSTAERRALAGLLGRPPSAGRSMRLRISEIDTVLERAGLAASLRDALVLLDGPLVDLKAARAAQESGWRELVSAASREDMQRHDADVRAPSPTLRSLVEDAGAVALLKRLSAGDSQRAALLLNRVGRVLERLPARGIPLPRLAADALGDSHALDPGRPEATLVLRTDNVDGMPLIEERLHSRLSLRDRWARLGVTVNELARPALCLNLPFGQPSASAPASMLRGAAGEPHYLSLRVLLRESPAWDVAGRDVFVCENPTIVTIAADSLGPRCAPLLCTEGMPAAAQQTLFTQVTRCGGRLRYHGDFDWSGIAIGNFVLRTYGATPWRYGCNDYAAACPDRGKPLGTRGVTNSEWDSELTTVMTQRGFCVHEEAVVDRLLEDLGASSGYGPG